MKARKADDPLGMVTEWIRVTDTQYQCVCCGQVAHPSRLIIVEGVKDVVEPR